MRFGIKSLLILMAIAALIAYLFAPPSPLTLKTLPTAKPTLEPRLLTLTPTYRAGKWLIDSDSVRDQCIAPEDYYGQEYSKVTITSDWQDKVWRELVFDVGENGKKDLRARAVLLDAIPAFEDLKKFKTIAEFDAAFERTERSSAEHVAFEEYHAQQYWGGFVIEGEKLRVVFVAATIICSGGDEWAILERTIRESNYEAMW